jgi:carbonic anhydrase
VRHLGVPLLLVLGHEGCGAVKAALEGEADGAVGELISQIQPVVRPVMEQVERVKNTLMEAVQANVWHTMGMLVERSPVIAGAVRSGDLVLAGAVYSLTSGKVSVLEEKG